MTPQEFVAAHRRRTAALPRRLPHRVRQLALDRLPPRTRVFAQDIYRTLRAAGSDRHQRTIEQFFDPVKGMFLPDRYIKGECPKCGAKDQYGDTCEVCGCRLRARPT